MVAKSFFKKEKKEKKKKKERVYVWYWIEQTWDCLD